MKPSAEPPLAEPGARPTPVGSGALSEDTLLNGRIRLRQHLRGYRVAIDPVLLAAAVPARAGESVLDLGCGVGAAGLCLLSRCPACDVVGLEREAALVELARGNAALNGFSERFSVVTGDVTARPLPAAVQGRDHVMCNPPFLEADSGTTSPEPGNEGAKREDSARLDDWIEAALSAVRPKGSLTFVHRADRLEALLAGLHGRAGEIVVYPLWPQPPGDDKARPAKRVLVRARKAVAGPTRLASGLVLHDRDGAFTPAAQAVLREAAGLSL